MRLRRPRRSPPSPSPRRGPRRRRCVRGRRPRVGGHRRGGVGGVGGGGGRAERFSRPLHGGEKLAPTEAAARAPSAGSSTLRLPQWLTRRFTRGRGAVSGRRAEAGGRLSARRQPHRASPLARSTAGRRRRRGWPSELRAHAQGADAVTRTRFASAWFPMPLLMHVCDLVSQAPALTAGPSLSRRSTSTGGDGGGQRQARRVRRATVMKHEFGLAQPARTMNARVVTF